MLHCKPFVVAEICLDNGRESMPHNNIRVNQLLSERNTGFNIPSTLLQIIQIKQYGFYNKCDVNTTAKALRHHDGKQMAMYIPFTYRSQTLTIP